MDRDTVNEMIKTLVVRDISLKRFSLLEQELRSIIHGIEFDPGRFTCYVNGEKMDIKDLAKKGNPVFDSMEKEKQEKLRDIVKAAKDARTDIISNIDYRAISLFTDHFMHSLDKRRNDLVEITSTLCGNYDFDDNFFISISNHPFDVLAKSSGQAWSWLSSEKIHGKFDKGIFSDIENGSAVAFLVGKKTGITNARVMLRVCFDNYVKGVGIEARIYFDNGKKGMQVPVTSKKQIALNVPAVKFFKGIVHILKENDLYNYNACTTPFSYQGFSDTSLKVRSEITYKKKKMKSTIDVKRSEDGTCRQVYE